MSYRGETVELVAEAVDVAALAGATMDGNAVMEMTAIIKRAMYFGNWGRPMPEDEVALLREGLGLDPQWTEEVGE